MKSIKIISIIILHFFSTLLTGQQLIAPLNEKLVHENQILFRWDGKDLSSEKVIYKLYLKQVESKQIPIDAAIENKVIFESDFIKTESLNLDIQEVKLNSNNVYVWQVVAYHSSSEKRKKEVSRSQVRTFRIFGASDITRFLSIDKGEIDEGVIRSFSAPAPPSDCINSNFELGTLQGWNGYYGSRSNSGTIHLNNLNNGIINGRHTLISTPGSFDPNVGGNILPQVSQGNHSLMLGNNSTGGDADLISYTFNVTQQNKNFSFQYALVLENPSGHDDDEQPFFGYYILKGSSILFSFNNFPVAGDYVVADSDNKFFKTTNSGIVYREWTPTCIDLSNYLGETMTIVFYVADCSLGGHYGYAYIDALCENNEAIASFSMPSEICPNQNLIIDGSASTNETSYFWSIEESDINGGRPNPSSEVSGWVVAQQAGNAINYSSFYQSKGKQFECNKYYRIKLAVNNDCTLWNEKVRVLYVKCPSINAGNDQCVSCTPTGNSIQLGQGNSNASGLNYNWTPGTGLSNSSSPSPSHTEGSVTYPFTYQVTVTDNDGCSNTDQVTLYCQPSALTLTKSKYCCGYVLTANASNYDNITWSTGETGVTSINVTSSGNYSVTVSNNCGQATESINVPSGNFLTGFFNVIAYNSKFYPPSGGYGLSDKLYIKDVMSGNGAANIPNSYNATEYKLEIYNRWGTLIKSMTGLNCEGFNNWSINWDGKDQSGVLVQQGVYVWRLYFKNCQYTSWWQPKERRFVDRVCIDCGGWPGNGCGFWNRCKQWNVPAGTTEDVIITHGSVTVVR